MLASKRYDIKQEDIAIIGRNASGTFLFFNCACGYKSDKNLIVCARYTYERGRYNMRLGKLYYRPDLEDAIIECLQQHRTKTADEVRDFVAKRAQLMRSVDQVPFRLYCCVSFFFHY